MTDSDQLQIMEGRLFIASESIPLASPTIRIAPSQMGEATVIVTIPLANNQQFIDAWQRAIQPYPAGTVPKLGIVSTAPAIGSVLPTVPFGYSASVSVQAFSQRPEFRNEPAGYSASVTTQAFSQRPEFRNEPEGNSPTMSKLALSLISASGNVPLGYSATVNALAFLGFSGSDVNPGLGNSLSSFFTAAESVWGFSPKMMPATILHKALRDFVVGSGVESALFGASEASPAFATEQSGHDALEFNPAINVGTTTNITITGRSPLGTRRIIAMHAIKRMRVEINEGDTANMQIHFTLRAIPDVSQVLSVVDGGATQ